MEMAQRACRGYVFALVIATLLLASCSDIQRVGIHQYRVPADSLISQDSFPFFLPRSTADGFIFILNPDAARTEQRNILVQRRDTICARAKGRQAYVNATICAPQRIEWRGRRWRKSGDETFWTFSPEQPSGLPAPFISCYKLEIPGHPGQRQATLPAGDLALTIDLNADELPILEKRFDEAMAALKRWQV